MSAMVIRVILACPRHVRLEGNLGIAGCPVCLVDALCLRFCRASRFSAMRGWRGAEKEDRGGGVMMMSRALRLFCIECVTCATALRWL
jgi:hypothetical protein